MGRRKRKLTSLMQRIAISLTLFVTIGTFILFYAVSRRVLLERTCRADVENLHQVYRAVENMHTTGTALGQQVYNDNQVAYLLYSNQFDPNKLCVAIGQLNNYRMTTPYVDSIYIYNSYLDSITVSSSSFGTYDAPLEGSQAFFDAAVMDLLGAEPSRTVLPVPRRVLYDGEDLCYYTSLTSDSFLAGQRRNAVFVNWSSEYLERVITSSPGTLGSTMILDKLGMVISGCGEYDTLEDISGEGFFRQIQGRQGEGYIIMDIRGEKTVVSYMCPEKGPWQYLRFTPYHRILGEIDKSMRELVFLSMVVVVLGTVASYGFTLVVRRPVDRIYTRMERLEEEGRNTRQSYRQELLRDMLYGTQSPTYALRQGVLDGLGIRGEGQRCVLVLLRLRGCQDVPLTGDSDQLRITRYGVSNIAVEICQEEFPALGIDLGGRSLALQGEQACAVMHEIIGETEQYAFCVANMVVSRLTLALLGMEEDLLGSGLMEDVSPFPTINLMEKDSIENVCAQLDGIVRRLVAVLEHKRNGYHSILVQKINTILQENYRDTGCCLDSIAETMGLSPAYAGKLYKRYALKSVAESIAELRMKEAKRLLREEKKLAIAEVAARSGFSSSSYFSKVFQKENGMPPNEYRNLDSKGGSK